MSLINASIVLSEGSSDKGVNYRSMREFKPTTMKSVNVFVQQIASSSEQRDSVANMTDRCKYFRIDVIGQLGFGTALTLQTDRKTRFMVKGRETSNYRTNVYIQFPPLEKIGMELLLHSFEGLDSCTSISRKTCEARSLPLCFQVAKLAIH